MILPAALAAVALLLAVAAIAHAVGAWIDREEPHA